MPALSDTQASAAEQLTRLIGPEAVADAEAVNDYAIGAFLPTAVALPSESAQVSEILRWAQSSGVAVYPVGGRTLGKLGNVPTRAGVALDLTGLNKLMDFQSADLTVRMEAGMTVSRLDATLAQDGKIVPLGAPLADRATIGGTLATGISGPLRATYGLPRDWLIGVGVIAADGGATKAGGQVVKNVTGYDLNRLYTGSLGTLGIIVEATFKITPRPTAWAAVIAAFESDAAALAACRNLLDQPIAPQALHVLNPSAARRLGNPDIPAGYGPVAVATICGRPSSVRRRAQDTAVTWLDAASALHISGNEATALCDAIGDMPFEPEGGPSVSVRVNAPPQGIGALLELGNSHALGEDTGIIADAGFGGGRVLCWQEIGEDDVEPAVERIRTIQACAEQLGGDTVVEICPDDVKSRMDVWGPAPSGMAIMRRIKEQFDPNNVLNPGRFIGGL